MPNKLAIYGKQQMKMKDCALVKEVPTVRVVKS